jgi:hypothetical protein
VRDLRHEVLDAGNPVTQPALVSWVLTSAELAVELFTAVRPNRRKRIRAYEAAARAAYEAEDPAT